MANPEHLAKLKEGVEAWNQWQKQNPKVKIGLEKGDLGRADLIWANLSQTTLVGTILRYVSLVDGDRRSPANSLSL